MSATALLLGLIVLPSVAGLVFAPALIERNLLRPYWLVPKRQCASLYLLTLPVPIPAPLFAVGYLAYTWYAARRARGRVNHDAHLSGAVAGLAFVALTDPRAWQRALALVFHYH